ncbi:MAG: hypothetical protein PHI34_03495 [Acidobacteriota bacterium]|nr:hypothetical protein [Acidobacteriota bacterium]
MIAAPISAAATGPTPQHLEEKIARPNGLLRIFMFPCNYSLHYKRLTAVAGLMSSLIGSFDISMLLDLKFFPKGNQHMPTTLNEILQTFAHIAAILGIPIAIILFINEKRKERRDREWGTYDALDDKWKDFLHLCIQHPEFDLYDIPLEKKVGLTPEQKIQQYAMFEILISLLERAFLMYRDQSDKIKKTQWKGWSEYMRDYARRETFHHLWKLRGIEYDQDFMDYIDPIIKE